MNAMTCFKSFGRCLHVCRASSGLRSKTARFANSEAASQIQAIAIGSLPGIAQHSHTRQRLHTSTARRAVARPVATTSVVFPSAGPNLLQKQLPTKLASALVAAAASSDAAGALNGADAVLPPPFISIGPYDKSYQNYVALTGTLIRTIPRSDGTFAFVLEVLNREKSFNAPGQPMVYQPFVIEVPQELAQECAQTLLVDMQLEVSGKLACTTSPSAAAGSVVKIVATGIRRIKPRLPEQAFIYQGPIGPI